MTDKVAKKKSTPFVVFLPILVVLFIAFQNEKRDKKEAEDVIDNTTVSSSVSDANDSDSETFLTEVGAETFESPAGLIYTTGSADGHRLDHLMKHAADEPDKPVHGVFDGERGEILALLDEVWKTSQERGPPDVEIQKNGDRTVITVDMHRKVGYVGGKSGKRKGYPSCSRVRLVVEDKNVITAYPML